MWGIFGKPLKRAIWNTLGLHAVLTVCLRFLSFLDGTCVACCLFFNRQPPCPLTNSSNLLLHPQMHRKNLWFAKEHALGVQPGCGLLAKKPLAP